MKNSTNFISSSLFTFIFFVAVALMSACGGDDEATPNCGSLGLDLETEGLNIIATASGGTPPYEYSLNGGTFQESGNFSEVTAGTNSVTVVDANQCTEIQTIEVVSPCESLEATVVNEGFSITVTATGGEAPYSFQLGNRAPQSSGIFIVEEPGTYVIIVSDANNCALTQTIEVLDPCANFSVLATASAYDLTIAITDGAAPFSYSFENGDSTYSGEINERTITVELVEAENTTVAITDANDCETEDTLEAGDIASFTDKDGQIYDVVKIGEQIWLAENYNRDTAEGSYCYDNDEAKCETYGRLYTWNKATSEGFAPTGWSLPSEADFQSLIDFVGTDAGAELKVGGSSGFDAMLAGVRINSSETFNEIDETGNFWTSTVSSLSDAESIFCNVDVLSDVARINDTNKFNALSIRFIKN